MKKVLLTLAAFFAVLTISLAQNSATVTINGTATALVGITLANADGIPDLGPVLPATYKTTFPVNSTYLWQATGAGGAKIIWTPDFMDYHTSGHTFTNVPVGASMSNFTLAGLFSFSNDGGATYIQNSPPYNTTLNNGPLNSSGVLGNALTKFVPNYLSNTGYTLGVGTATVTLPVGMTVAYDPVQ